MNNNVIITIGRQFGSGGRQIGKLLAEDLKIPYYDKELLLIAAQESGLDKQFLESRDETGANSLLYSLAMGVGRNHLTAQENYSVDALAKKAQYDAVHSVAQKSGCVIVGRCADYILRDYQNLLRVFIAAEIDDRIAHVSQRDGIRSDEAAKKIRRLDKERSLYYYRNTDQRWGNAASYDLCINTSKTDSRGAVTLIKDFLSLRKIEK